MRRRVLFLSMGLLCAAGISLSVMAHGGGLDRCGGHNDRKRGGYHVHNWTSYCACHPEAAECATHSGASTPSTGASPPTTPSFPATGTLADLRVRVEKLEARVTALEVRLASR